MIIGAQLYTVRDFCKTTDDLAETLKKVADIGYTEVQLSGVCDYDAAWMAEQLKANGLRASITHFAYDRIVNDTEATIAFHKTMNTRYIGLGSIPNFKKLGGTEEVVNRYMDAIAPAVEKISAAGLKFMYHNHNMEVLRYPDGTNVLERMCERFPADKYGITLDTYWVVAGGADPVVWLPKLKGRVNCVHFKDMIYNIEDTAVRMAPIGWGNMNYPAILKACVDSDVEVAYIEQDRCYDEDPFHCLKKSYDYLTAQGFH